MRVAAASVYPIDYKRRAGLTKDFYPIHFPGLIGVDMAGTVVKVGQGVEAFTAGNRVFAMADNTYAELCVVKADVLADVPEGLGLIEAAALPLVTTTGNQLLSATGIKAGQTDGRGSRRKCRAFGSIHCEGTRGDCDGRGFESRWMGRRLWAWIKWSQPTTTPQLRMFRRSMRWRIRSAEELPRS